MNFRCATLENTQQLLGLFIWLNLELPWGTLMAQTVKHLPAMLETRVQSLGWEDPLEKEMANHSSILAWKIPWTEEPRGLQSMGYRELDTTERLHFNLESIWS